MEEYRQPTGLRVLSIRYNDHEAAAFGALSCEFYLTTCIAV